jgi:YD repeat-containing protein
VTTGTGSGFVDWYPTRLVQDWVSGAVPNYGFLIRDVNPNTTANELDFHQREGGSVTPELDIVWSERTGLSDNYDFDGQALDGKTDIAVNVANGNLFVDTRGLSAPGNGLDLELQNYHNSLASPTELQGEGIRGTASLGGDVRLKVFDPTTVAFFRGDGLNASFLSPTVSGTTATYITPPEFGNATLTRDTSTNVYTLNLPNGAPAWPDVDLTMTFAPSGTLTSVKDAAGHAISLSYFSGGGQELPGLSGITDTNGASFTLEPNPAGDSYISDVTDPAGHHWSYVYGHDNTDYLTTYTAGDTGQTWHYDYDSSHRLTSVTTPDGKVTKITYVGTTSKTASIMVTTDAAHTTGPTTTYAYSEPSAPCDPANGDIGKTVVTPPSGPAVTYCHDAQDQITYDDRVTGDADASCDTSTPVDDGEGPVDCSAPEPDLSVWPSLDPDAPHDPAPQGLAAAAATPPVPTRFAWAFSDQNPEFLQQPGTPPSVVARMIPQSPNDLPIVRLTVPYNAVSDAPTTDPGDPGPGGGSVHKAHLRYVRLQRVKAWITAAYAAHKRVLISFEHCATVTPGANAAAQSQPDDQDAGWCAKPENRPTTRAYHDAVKAFLTYNPAGGPDFRQIEFFTAWNEPNHSKTQPTGGTDPHDVDENHRHDVNVTNSGAFQAGEYFYTLDHMCRAFYGCTVGAGDFSDFDLPNAIASKYLTEYKLGMRRNPPAFWAWHAYKDTLQAITTPTSAHWSILKKFLRATEIRSRTPAKQPPVMITEVGITYAASTGRSDQVGNNDDRANLGMQRLMTEAPVAHTTDPRTRGRIKSLFYYALRGALAPDGTQHAFDSGLISPANNHVRPMWQTWCNTVTGATCDTSLVGQDAGPRDQNLYP